MKPDRSAVGRSDYAAFRTGVVSGFRPGLPDAGRTRLWAASITVGPETSIAVQRRTLRAEKRASVETRGDRPAGSGRVEDGGNGSVASVPQRLDALPVTWLPVAILAVSTLGLLTNIAAVACGVTGTAVLVASAVQRSAGAPVIAAAPLSRSVASATMVEDAAPVSVLRSTSLRISIAAGSGIRACADLPFKLLT